MAWQLEELKTTQWTDGSGSADASYGGSTDAPEQPPYATGEIH